MNDKEQLEHFRQKLRDRMNRVPEKVSSGTVQMTRSWMANRARAEKLVKKTNVAVAELMAAIASLE